MAERLFDLAEKGDLVGIQKLLKWRPYLLESLNGTLPAQENILRTSARRSHAHIVRWLIESGRVKKGYRERHRSYFMRFLSSRLHVDCETKQSRTPLELAAREGHLGVVNQLLDAGGDSGLLKPRYLKYHSVKSSGALDIAAEKGHENIVDAILKKYDTHEWSYIGPLDSVVRTAADAGHYHIVILILSKLNAQARKPVVLSTLSSGVRDRHVEMVAQLSERFPDALTLDENDARKYYGLYGHHRLCPFGGGGRYTERP